MRNRLTNLASDHTGLSLIEVLVSLLIFSIAVLGMAPLMVVSMKSNTYSRDLTLATQLAKEKLEDFEAADSLPTAPYSYYESGLQSKFSRSTWVIDSVSDTLIPGTCSRIDVVVTWSGEDSLSHSTQMSTLIQKE